MEMPSAGERLISAGSEYFPFIIGLLLSIFIIAGISFVVLSILNKKNPPEEKRSNFFLFIVSLMIGFFITSLFFVYKVVLIGLEHLFK
jgi:hypothetical protein